MQTVCMKDFFFCWQLELATKTSTNVFGAVEKHLIVFAGRTDCAGSALNFWIAELNVREELKKKKKHPENRKYSEEYDLFMFQFLS